MTKPVDTEKSVPDGFFLTSNVHIKFTTSLHKFHQVRSLFVTVCGRHGCGVAVMVCSRYCRSTVCHFVWLGGVAVGRRISDREVTCSIPGCSTGASRLRLGVKCTTGAVLGMLAAIRQTLRLAANKRHSSIVLTCGCRCTAALM